MDEKRSFWYTVQEEENELNEGKWRNGLVRPFHAPSWGLTSEPWLAMARPARDHFGSFDENFFCGLWVMPSTEVPQIAHAGPSLPSFTFCQMPDQCKYTHTYIHTYLHLDPMFASMERRHTNRNIFNIDPNLMLHRSEHRVKVEIKVDIENSRQTTS